MRSDGIRLGDGVEIWYMLGWESLIEFTQVLLE